MINPQGKTDRIIAAYGRGLAKVLNHPWLTLSVALSTLLLSVLLWVFIPKGFFPVQDNGIIQTVFYYNFAPGWSQSIFCRLVTILRHPP